MHPYFFEYESVPVPSNRAVFGERRLHRGFVQRVYYRTFGAVDPAHYLHHRYLVAALDDLSPIRPESVLDAGCGGGDHSIWLARRFPSANVLGIDINPQALSSAATAARRFGLNHLHFEQKDILDIDKGEYDLIVSVDVLEHIGEQGKALGALFDALRPGGYAFLHVPVARPKPVLLSRYLTDFHAWAEREHIAEELTRDGFVRAVAAAGFTVLSSTGTFGRWTGELATSLFALPYNNMAMQAVLGPVCKLLAMADRVSQKTRYGAAVLAQRVSR